MIHILIFQKNKLKRVKKNRSVKLNESERDLYKLKLTFNSNRYDMSNKHSKGETFPPLRMWNIKKINLQIKNKIHEILCNKIK